MTGSDILTSRLDAVFGAARERVWGMHVEAIRASEIAHSRFNSFSRLRACVNELTAPRLKQLQERLAEAVTTTVPSPHGDSVVLRLASTAAKIVMEFSLSHDGSLAQAFLDYRLEILPVFIRFDRHVRLEIPLDPAECDPGTIAQWLDDRIVGFARAYTDMHFVSHYRWGNMVVDPVAQVSFPKAFGRSSLEYGGETYHFVSEETRRKFEDGPAPYALTRDASPAAGPNHRLAGCPTLNGAAEHNPEDTPCPSPAVSS